MAYRITAPIADFNGVSAGVAFNGGTGETDDLVKVAYFRRHDYTVAEIVEDPTPIAEPDGNTGGKTAIKTAAK
jgi:hypothetical protein